MKMMTPPLGARIRLTANWAMLCGRLRAMCIGP